MSSEHDEFMKDFTEKHTDNAFRLVTCQVNGLPDRTGRNDVVSLRCTYTLDTGETKTIKFYMPRIEAFGLGELMREAAAEDSESQNTIH